MPGRSVSAAHVGWLSPIAQWNCCHLLCGPPGTGLEPWDLLKKRKTHLWRNSNIDSLCPVYWTILLIMILLWLVDEWLYKVDEYHMFRSCCMGPAHLTCSYKVAMKRMGIEVFADRFGCCHKGLTDYLTPKQTLGVGYPVMRPSGGRLDKQLKNLKSCRNTKQTQ